MRLDDSLSEAMRRIDSGPHDIVPFDAPIGKEEAFEFCFLDQYTYDRDTIAAYQALARRLIVFDELAKIDFTDTFRERDTIVRAQLLARPSPASPGPCRILCGLSYFVINRTYPDNQKKPEREETDILVLLGGGAGHGLTYQWLADAFDERLAGRSVSLRFILGANAPDDIMSALQTRLPWAHIEAYVRDPVSAMRSSKIGIMSGGYSKYEAAYAGLPSVLLAVQDHQVEIAESFCKAGGGVYAGDGRDAAAVIAAVDQAITMLDSPDLAKTLSSRAGALIDGRGLDRVFAASAAP